MVRDSELVEACNNDSNTRFIKTYRSLSGAEVPPSYAAYNSYAAIRMFKAAVEKAGSFDRAAVARALSGLAVQDLPVGPTTFRGKTIKRSLMWRSARLPRVSASSTRGSDRLNP